MNERNGVTVKTVGRTAGVDRGEEKRGKEKTIRGTTIIILPRISAVQLPQMCL